MPYWDQLIRQVETVLEKWHDKDGGTQKDYDGFFINNIVLKSYSCDNNKIEIEYLIDEKLYNLLIMYKTCEKCLQND